MKNTFNFLRKGRAKATPFWLLLVSLACFAQAQERAKSADSFVESIGVNLHLPYRGSYDQYETVIKPRLLELGVHHVMDGSFARDPGDNSYQFAYDRWKDLGNNGIKLSLHHIQSIDNLKRLLKYLGPSTMEAVCGPNEIDLFPFEYNGQTNWVSVASVYQRDLYNAIKADPELSYLPVVGLSLGWAGNAPQIGNVLQPYADIRNGHFYTADAGSPGDALDGWHLRWINDILYPDQTKPLWVTEAGYSSGWDGGHVGVEDFAADRYMPRLLLEHWRKNVQRTYLYEFIDQRADNSVEGEFGLLKSDGTPKPSFNTIKNMITLLKEPGVNFTPGTLNYTVSGGSSTVHHFVLQKSSGAFYLVIWNDAKNFNMGARTEIRVGDEPVTLSLGTAITSARTFLPQNSTNVVNTYSNPTSVALSVPDHPLIVELSPNGIVSPTPDLIVSDITWTPANPVTGNAVTFSAVVRNQGTAATPAGTIIGVAFSVDGNVVSWSDNSTASLGAGQSRTVTANGGPTGATWSATTGTHTILAHVDDINRMVEGNETNNTRSETINVSTSAPTASTLTPVADAFVRSGIYATTNYGSNPSLLVKTEAGDFNRYSYLKFDLGAVATVNTARLRLYGLTSGGANIAADNNVTVSVYAVSNTSWTETGINWNNKPATSGTARTFTATRTAGWYEVDLTSYVQAEKAAGRNIISLGLVNATSSASVVTINSRENGANRPALVINGTGSARAAVSEAPLPPSLRVYPNPLGAGNALKVSYRATRAGKVRVVITNALGRRRFNKEIAVEQGINHLELGGMQLESGVFYLLIVSAEGKAGAKIMVNK